MKNKLNLIILIVGFASCKSNNNKSSPVAAKIDSLPQSAVVLNKATPDTSSKKNQNIDEYAEKYQLKNDSLDIILSISKPSAKDSKFQLDISVNKNIHHLNGTAELVLVENSDGSMTVPEGTAILDKTTQKEYFCDSTFMYVSKNINISYAPESKTRKRLSLLLYKSMLPGINNSDYTLYNND